MPIIWTGEEDTTPIYWNGHSPNPRIVLAVVVVVVSVALIVWSLW